MRAGQRNDTVRDELDAADSDKYFAEISEVRTTVLILFRRADDVLVYRYFRGIDQ